MSELRLLKFQTCANSTTDQWKIYPVYQMAQVHPSPLIAMKQKKKTKKNKRKTTEAATSTTMKEIRKGQRVGFFLGEVQIF